jgi:hypothetical protein
MAPPKASAPRKKPLPLPLKILVALAAVAGLGFVFLRTVRSSRSAPYVVPASSNGAWRLSVEKADRPADPVLLLEPPSTLAHDLFDQVFKRSMESMAAPQLMGIPLVLASEVERAGAAGLSTDAILAMARDAGLEATPPVPRCMGHRRAPEPDTRQQIYFAIFDSPAFKDFRQRLGVRLGASFDPDFVSPVLFIGVVESSIQRWVPMHTDVARDCLAPIDVAQQ